MTFYTLPIGKPRMVKSDTWRKRPCVQRYWEYKDSIRYQLEQEGWEVGNQVQVLFVLPMPESWSKKKKERMLGVPHKQKPDIDNLVKAFLDACLEDDTPVWRVFAEKRWGTVGLIEAYNL